MVLAAHLGTLYPGAQLDSGLKHVDVVTAAGLDVLVAPWLWAIAVFPLAAPALVVLVLVGWTGGVTGRWWVSALQPGLGLAVPHLWRGAPGWQLPAARAQIDLMRVMHRWHRPFLWLGEDQHSLDLKVWLLWGRKNPLPGVDRGEGCCLPCQGLWRLVCALLPWLH